MRIAKNNKNSVSFVNIILVLCVLRVLKNNSKVQHSKEYKNSIYQIKWKQTIVNLYKIRIKAWLSNVFV